MKCLRIFGFITAILLFGLLGCKTQFSPQDDSKNATNPVSLDAKEGEKIWFASAADLRLEDLKNGAPWSFSESEWKSVPVPGNISQFFPGEKHIWLGRTIEFSRIPDVAYSIRLGMISDSDRVYWNGELIGQTGDAKELSPQAYDKIRLYDIPPDGMRKGKNVLLIRISRYFSGELGVVKDRTSLGPDSVLRREFYLRSTIDLLFLASYATVVLYFLFLFIRRAQNRSHLYFSVFVLFLVIYLFNRNQFKYEFDLPLSFLKRTEYSSMYAAFVFYYLFHLTYFPRSQTKIGVFSDRLGLAVSALLLCWIPVIWLVSNAEVWTFTNKRVVQPVIFPILVSVGVRILGSNILKGNRDAIFMCMGFVAVVFGTIMDILAAQGFLNLPSVTNFTFFLYIISLAVVLANRMVRLQEEVLDLNRNLEQKVRSRTEELSNSLEAVNKLKEQQDGDYFLTSILLTPLSGNHHQAGSLQVDIFEKQKKSFSFRKRTGEIGGDLSVAYDIILRGKKYAAVLNGDAMGKSIQGAGGALVLGTVFKSVVARTMINSKASDISPEKWLHGCFMELQSVFVSFDGTMAVSISMGLIEEDTGVLYYVVAEHPKPVLYRDGIAEFVESPSQIFKVGYEAVESEFSVGVFRMKNGDKILFGSDGRDDVQIGSDDSGSRIINEDEHKFLEFVRSGSGELRKIYESILDFGELTDDLSLLSVVYLSDQSDMGDPSVRKEAIRAYKEKDYKQAAASVARYLQDSPEDTDALLLACVCLRKIESFSEAIEFGERYRLRRPFDVQGKANLARLYQKIGNRERAAYLMRESTVSIS